MAAPRDAVRGLLRQLLLHRFVLTDRSGSVTRWSRPAEGLFGWDSDVAVGRGLLDTIGCASLDIPEVGGQIEQVAAHTADGREVPVNLTFVPVPMSQSLEFTGFLEGLETGGPPEAMLDHMRDRHAAVVDWIDAVLLGEAELGEDELIAGTIVSFQPLDESLWEETTDEPAAVPKPEAAPTPGEDHLRPADVLDRVDEALERSADLERALISITASLEEAHVGAEEARNDAQAARREAAEAAARAAEAEERNAELRARFEETRRELGDSVSSLGEQSGRLRTDLADTRLALDEAVDRLAQPDSKLQAELEGTRQELHDALERIGDPEQRLETELGAMRERLEEAAVEPGERIRADLEELRARLEETAGRIEAPDVLHEGLEDTRRRVEELAAAGEQPDERLVEELSAAESRIEALEKTMAEKDEAPGPEEQIRTEVERLQEQIEELRMRAAQASADEAGDVKELAALADSRLEQLREEAQSAREAADAAKEHALHAEKVREAVEGHAADSEQAASTVAETVARAEEAAAGIEAVAARAEESVTRAEEAAAAAALSEQVAAGAETHAESAAKAAAEVATLASDVEQTATRVERGAERVDEAAAGIERGAERAESAAGSAERSSEAAREALESVGVEARVARVQAEAARVHAQTAGTHAKSSSEVAGSWRRPDVSHAPPPMREMVGVARRRRVAAIARDPRPGFDDADKAMATIDLNGHFRELNGAFSSLVGYGEAEFRAAVWPPVIDRANLRKHRSDLKALRAGELDSAEVDTGYMHAQGLQVPVVGQLSLVRDDSGEPSHLLLEVAAPPSRSRNAFS